MRLVVVDGNGEQQTVIAQALDEPVDASDVCAGGTQPLLAANANRAGWFFQNNGTHAMRVNELGADATLAGAFVVAPGATFPPPGYPVTTGQINVSGTAAEVFTCREWSTPA